MRAAAVLLATLLATACLTTAGTTPTGPPPSGRVRDIELSPLRGEVGKPFSATVTWSDNYIRDPELKVNGAPEGLAFDPAARTLSGKPKQAGFFTVQVAVRQRPKDEPNHRPTPDERWWTAEFELEIFQPLQP